MENRNDRNKIDDLFSEGLRGFQETPPVSAWGRISSDLAAERRKKRLVLLRYAALVAILLSAVGVGFILYPVGSGVDGDLMVENLKQEPRSFEAAATMFCCADSVVEHNHLLAKTKKTANDELLAVEREALDPLGDEQLAQNSSPTTATVSLEAESPVDENVFSEIDPSNVVTDGMLAQANTYEASKKSEQSVSLSNTESRAKSFINKVRRLVVGEINNEKFRNPQPQYTADLTYALLTVEEKVQLISSNFPEDEKSDQNDRKWSLGGEITPTYSFKNSGGKMAKEMQLYANNTRLSNTKESPMASISMGLNAGYKVASRLTVESGIYFTRFGHQNQDLWLEENYSSREHGASYIINTSAGDIQMRGIPSEIKDQTITTTLDEYLNIERRYNRALEGQAQINVTQRFEYLEVPVLLKYRLNEGKIGVNIVGGVSSGILVGNYSLMSNEGENVFIGETENIQNMLYNGIVGLGVNYSISEHIDLSMEPMLKYSINSLSSDPGINYKPYSLGWYTGLKYKF